MKQFVFLLLLSPLFAFAQECEVKKQKDQFSQEMKYSSGFMHFNSSKGEKVSLSIEADSKEIRLLFSVRENCFNDQSKAALVFDGSKSKSTQKNASAMNCDGIFTILFRNTATTPFALKKIASQKLTSIVFTGSNNQTVEVILSDEEKALLMERANCMVNEARALIKTS